MKPCTSEDKYSNVKRCINCGLAKIHRQNIQSLPEKFQEILMHWIGYEPSIFKQSSGDNAISQSTSNSIPTYYGLCYKCFNLINVFSNSTEKDIPERVLGHAEVCVGCGMSQYRKQRKVTEIKKELLPYLNKYWPWHKVIKNKIYCHKCDLRLTRMIKKENKIGEETTNESEPELIKKCEHLNIAKNLDKGITPRFVPELKQIILSDGKRSPYTKRCCYTNKCTAVTKYRKRIPKSKRRLIATCYDVFLPNDTRACEGHLTFDGFQTTLENNSFRWNFTVPQFETFVDEIKQGMVVIDFENVEAMPNHICEYWTGVNVGRFIQMYEELGQPKIMKTALAIYLIRKITGDSVQKLAKLFNINSFTLKKQVKIVDRLFLQIE